MGAACRSPAFSRHDQHSSWLAGGLLLIAGVFQWTPLKSACLRHCRSPLNFLLAGWREGKRGAMVMGFGMALIAPAVAGF